MMVQINSDWFDKLRFLRSEIGLINWRYAINREWFEW